MSGFVALINEDHRPTDVKVLRSLTCCLQYRGPDSQATWVDNHVGFGHALFRTTFESKYENQPASIDGRVWIICSARIDGRQDLLNHLGLSGSCDLTTTPDSELILRAYQKWGELCPNFIIGDFAFVIWDTGLQKLFCARDRFGMRQLYYARPKNSLVLCNSLQCIVKHPDINKKLNDQAIGDFLLFGDHTWPDKTQTAFEGVSCVPPAHSLIVENGRTKIRCYWDLPTDIPLLKYRKQEEYVEHFQEVFTTAIADRMRASRLVISLSGGLDSPSVAAAASAFQKRLPRVRAINGVSVFYSSVHPCRERYFIEKVAERLALPVAYIDAAQYKLFHPQQMDTTRPCEAYTPLLYQDFSRIAAQFGNVMLTGAAGDNLLGFIPLLKAKAAGIGWLDMIFEMIKMRHRYGAWPPLGTGMFTFFRRLKASHNLEEKENYPQYFNETFAKGVGLRQRLKDFNALQAENNNSKYLTARPALVEPDWNTDDFYTDMGFVRPEECDPFLDLRLVRTMLSLPQLPWIFNKHILRQAMEYQLPREILQRRKTPLGPVHTSLLKKYGEEAVFSVPLEESVSKYIDIDKVHKCWCKKTAYSTPYENLRPFLLQTWMNNVARW